MMNRPLGRRNIPTVLVSFGRHLVYAEGTKTEPLYVEDLKMFVSEELNVSKDDIEIVTPKTTKSHHTVDLVEFAIKDVEQRKRKQEQALFWTLLFPICAKIRTIKRRKA